MKYCIVVQELSTFQREKITKKLLEKFQFKEYNFTEEDLIKNIGQGCNDEELFQFSLQENFSYLKILASPVSSCKFCFRKLTQVRGKATQVVFFSQDGPIPASKFDYRCRGCPIENEGIPIDEKSDVIYSPTMFGTKTQGMRFYEESVGYTSASNVCYVDDRLLEMCASSNHHTWASL